MTDVTATPSCGGIARSSNRFSQHYIIALLLGFVWAEAQLSKGHFFVNVLHLAAGHGQVGVSAPIEF